MKDRIIAIGLRTNKESTIKKYHHPERLPVVCQSLKKFRFFWPNLDTPDLRLWNIRSQMGNTEELILKLRERHRNFIKVRERMKLREMAI